VTINPDAPILPEKDVALIPVYDEPYNPNDYPTAGTPPQTVDPLIDWQEVDINLLPGVPAQRGPTGPAGPTGVTGATGATGATGSSGVVSVTSPITNSGTSTSAIIGIDLTNIASTTFVNTAISTYAPKASPTFTGVVTVPNLDNSSSATTATNKAYVDSVTAALNVHDAVKYATTTNLSATYTAGTTDASGGTGIGATLVFAAVAIDGYTLVAQDATDGTRILVKNQTTQTQNGIYTVTAVGSNITLTRAVDSDNSIAGELSAGDFVFVSAGTQAATGWTQTTYGTGTAGGIKIGTDNVVYTQFSGAGTYTAGTGLQLNSGTQFAINTSVVPRLTAANAFTTGGHTITNDATGTVPLRILAITGQTANLLDIKDGSGTSQTIINSAGGIATAQRFTTGSITTSTAGHLAVILGVDRVGLAVRGTSGQTLNLQEWQDSAGTVLGGVASNGRIFAGNTTPMSASLGAYTNNSTRVGILSQGVSNQTADLFQYQNSGGTVLGGRNAVGQIYTGSTTPLQGGSTLAIGLQTPTGTTNISITVGSTHGIQVGQLVTIAGVTPSGYNGTWTAQSGTTGTTLVVNIGSNPGDITVAGTVTQSAQLSVQASNINNVPLVVYALASQAANLQEWRTPSGSQARISPTGQIATATNLAVGATSITNLNQFQVSTTAATQLGAVIKSATNQTADLAQYQSSGATVLGGRNANAQAFTGSTVPVFTAVGGTIQSIAATTNPLITMASTHGLAVGDLVQIAGTTGGTYNGTNLYVSAVPSTTTFNIISGLTVGQASAAGTVALPAQKSITARSAGTIPLLVKGATSQASDYLQIQNSAGTVVSRINVGGQIQASTIASTDGASAITLAGTRSIQVGSATADVAGGQGVIGITNRQAAPSGNPTTGGVLFAESGALKYLGTSGSAATIINADGTAPTTYTLPAANSTTLGGIKLFSDTTQTVAAATVSATTARTYGAQLNASNQLVVNVPWTDTTYTFASGSTNGSFSYTPLGGSATSVAIYGLGSAAYTASTAYISSTVMTALGDIIYGGSSGAATKLLGNTTTTKKFLRQTGDGTNSAAPAWDTVTSSDVGLGSVENTALSTWGGSTNVTTVGTIGTGIWDATAIADGKIASALTGKTYNKLTITAPANGSTLTILDGKTLTVNNTITLAGTDTKIYTFPTTDATIARTDAAQTFTGTQTFSTITAGTISGASGTTDIALNTAATTAAASGAINIATGTTTTSGATGAVTVKSGTSAGASGSVTISTGNTNNATAGAINLTGGTVSSGNGVGGAITIQAGTGGPSAGNGGAVSIDAGPKAGTGNNGAINIGTNTDAASITIGKSGSTNIITLNGTLVASAPAGSLTGSSLASGITTAPGLSTASSLASVGTITSGTWSATAIAAAKGGTGQTSFTQYGVAYGASSTALAETAAGTNGQVLSATSTAPVWATPFFMPRVAGDYYVNGQYSGTPGTASISTTTMAYVCVYLPAIQTVTSLGFYVATLGSSPVYQLGLYSNNASTNKPDTKVLDAGLITVTAIGANIISGLSYTLPSPGWYWVGIQLYSGTSGTLNLLTTTNLGLSAAIMPNTTASVTTLNTHWTQTVTAAQALPTTAGTVALATSGAPKVFVGI